MLFVIEQDATGCPTKLIIPTFVGGIVMQSTVKFVIKFSRSLVLLTLVLAMAGMAQAQKNQKKIAAKSEEARKAADVFTTIMNIPDKSIPRDLLNKAEAIAVFPGVVKGGFIIGARC